MREFTVPRIYTVPDERNVTHPIYELLEQDPTQPALAKLVDGNWCSVSLGDFIAESRALAKGLVAAGIEPGDRVAVMARTRYEWTVVETAIATAGAVLVPIYETSSAEQVWWILTDSGAKGLVVENDRHVALVHEALHDAADTLMTWVIDNGDLDDLAGSGGHVTDDDLDGRRLGRTAADLTMIIYTSGTTGRPKGCALDNRGSLSYLGNLMPAGMDRAFAPGTSTLLFLPLAHSFAQVIASGALAQRVRLGHCPDMKQVGAELPRFTPELVLSVPRVFEKLYNTAKHKAQAEGKGRIFDHAEKVAIRYSEALDSGGPGPVLRADHALLDKLVYTKIRDAVGGRLAWAISGGAPLGARLGHFFRGVGLTVLEGYGLTETTAGGTANLPGQQRVGSVGRPIPGMSIRIADDGEILMKGDLVFSGYWNNEDATKESFTSDGWFKTGDVGHLDDEGYLFITGRKKELIVTAAGKNVAPAVLEDRLRAHPLVSQCIVVGDSRPYIAALVTIDLESFDIWKTDNHIGADVPLADLLEDPRLLAAIQAGVDDANKAVSQAEAIKRFRLLDVDFTEAGGELTPTLKLKRNVVLKEHAGQVEALYA